VVKADYYWVQPTGPSAPSTNDVMRVEATVTGFIVHRPASGTAGLTYNWWRMASPSQAITFNAAASGKIQVATSGTVTVTVLAGTNRQTFVSVMNYGVVCDSVKNTTTGAKCVQAAYFAEGNIRDYIWRDSTVVTGSNVYTVYQNNSYASFGAIVLNGVNPVNPTGTVASTGNTGVTTFHVHLAVTGGQWAISIVGDGASGTFTTSSPTTERWAIDNNADGENATGGTTELPASQIDWVRAPSANPTILAIVVNPTP